MASSGPKRIRPRFPKDWHVPSDPKSWITWSHASSKLAHEKVFWVATASPDAKPHSAPVWGIWKGNTFFFETSPGSTKGRNLATNPRMTVHTQDGNDTVIIEGEAKREKGRSVLASLSRDYVAKYDYMPNWSDEQAQIVFRVAPKVVLAWKTPRMHRTMVRFVF